MRNFKGFLALLLGGLLAAAPAHAVTVNLFNDHYNLHTVAIGQTGKIDNDNIHVGFLGIGTANDGAFGFLPPDSEITFTYTLSGHNVIHFNTNHDLVAFGSYDYHSGGNHYRGASYVNSGAGGDYAHGSTNGSASAPLVLATADIIDGKHGTTTIVNDSSSKAFFLSTLNVGNLHGDLCVTYIVTALSAVPLPATLPLFAAALMMLMVYRKKARVRISFPG